MFVVVFLKEIQVFITVVEEWLFDVNEEKLKNRGSNPNHDVLLFWSEKGLIDGVPDANYPPNFTLEKSAIFPPQNGEACYIGRVKVYFGN